MGYDYSRQFLHQNRSLVTQLQEIYASGEVRAVTYDDHEDLQRARMLVSNVLASLELNYPDQFRGIRKTMRTWTDRTPDNKWRLYVGIPRHKVRGGRPGGSGQLPVSLTATYSYGPAHVVHPAIVDYGRVVDPTVEGEWTRFVAWVAETIVTSPSTQVIRAQFTETVDDPEVIEAFREKFGAIGLAPVVTGPSTLELHRGTVPDDQLSRGRKKAPSVQHPASPDRSTPGADRSDDSRKP